MFEWIKSPKGTISYKRMEGETDRTPESEGWGRGGCQKWSQSSSSKGD